MSDCGNAFSQATDLGAGAVISDIGTFAGLALTFTKRTPLAPDLTYIIETSPDLQTPWTAQVTHGLGNTDGTIICTLPTSGSKLFGRLRVQN